ncbi:MAG TPA: hypothetical protein VM871_06250, partial [Flavisolibacter sp.]|nr:hypothetical protein [Flavisolibacter sp.]
EDRADKKATNKVLAYLFRLYTIVKFYVLSIHNVLPTYYFLAFGIVFFFAFPLYQRRYYKNHDDLFIAEIIKTGLAKHLLLLLAKK